VWWADAITKSAEEEDYYQGDLVTILRLLSMLFESASWLYISDSELSACISRVKR